MRLFGSVKTAMISLFFLLLTIGLGLSQTDANSIISFIDPPKPGFARVTEVVDGDTIVVQFGGSTEKIRFIGVDTPETNHPSKAVQCYGKAATNYLKGLLENTEVRLEADPTNTNRDRYDRLLRYVYTEDGLLTNRQIIEEGYGFAYTAFPFEKREDFKLAQASAEAAKRGLWSNCEVEQDGVYFNTVPAEDASQLFDR